VLATTHSAIPIPIAVLDVLLTILLLLGQIAALLRRTGLAGAGLVAHAAFLTMLTGLRATALLIAADLAVSILSLLTLLPIARSCLLRLLIARGFAARLLLLLASVGPIGTIACHFQNLLSAARLTSL
jgi:hypothetical protein